MKSGKKKKFTSNEVESGASDFTEPTHIYLLNSDICLSVRSASLQRELINNNLNLLFGRAVKRKSEVDGVNELNFLRVLLNAMYSSFKFLLCIRCTFLRHSRDLLIRRNKVSPV